MDVPDSFNMVSALVDRHLTDGRGDKVSIYFRDQRITYESLYANVNRAGSVFQSLGLEREQRVLLVLNDTPTFHYVFLGAMKIGAVPVPVNVQATPDEYAFYLDDSRAAVLVVDIEHWCKIAPIQSRARFLKHIVIANATVPAAPLPPLLEEKSLDHLLATASPQLETVATSKDDQAYWLYTSGSTGVPKGVVHLHHDMVNCVGAYAQHVIDITENDILFSVSRLFFSYGLVNSLYLPLLAGAAVALLPTRPDPETVFAVIEKYRPTLFFAVPTFYGQMLNADANVDLSSIRLCISAGEALPVPILQRWQKRYGIEVLDGIGSSEVGYIFISNHPGRVCPGSSGELIIGYGAKVTDEEEREVARGHVGDLWIKGDSVCAMYWNRHALTKHTMHGEWIRTGDKYVQDEGGFFWHQGRSDDMLKVGGQWVSPVEVESALLTHQSVGDCAVVGMTDGNGLVKPKAFIVLKPGHTAEPDELKNHVRQKLSPHKCPRVIEFADELPRTPTGKLRRFMLRER